jgi:glycosyltransferase involved in cell wall biosynthesis
MLTYNRLEYTKRSLTRLLTDPTEEFDLTIWDNGSTDGTQEYLQSFNDRRIVDIHFSVTNKGQAYATNEIWSKSCSKLVGKVDNDCLVMPGWTKILAQAHEDLENLGVVGCWHFFPDDFDYNRARHKIQRFGKHQIFRHPWIDGSALLVKRSIYTSFGPCSDNEYLTGFWLRLALEGYINGFYYPLIFQDHLDDPLNPQCLIIDDRSFREHLQINQGLKAKRYNDIEGRKKWRQEIVRNLLDDPYDPRCYVGWRSRLTRLKSWIPKIHRM